MKMNVKIVYHSDTGNTKKIAMAISEATGVPAEETTGFSALSGTDLLFVGGSWRAFNLEKNCKEFLKSIPDTGVHNIALFSTSYSGKSIAKFAAKILKNTDIRILEEEYTCKSGVNKKTGETHPDEQDCANAQLFAKKVVASIASK